MLSTHPTENSAPDLRSAGWFSDCHPALRNLFFTAQLAQVAIRFEIDDHKALVLKGPVISVLAYGNIARRVYEDLDLLVDQADVVSARKLLQAACYKSDLPQHGRAILQATEKEELFLHHNPLVYLDLHKQLVNGWRSGMPQFDELWQRRQHVRIAGADIPTLSNEDHLVYLCVHGVEHMWLRGQWVRDIAGLAERQPIDWQVVWQRATHWQVKRTLCIGLRLATAFHGTPLPHWLHCEIDRDGIATQLTEQVATRLKAGVTSKPDRWTRFFFTWRSITNPVDRLRFAMHEFVLPTRYEVELVALPRPLWWLYAVIRPVRLVMKYTLGRVRAKS